MNDRTREAHQALLEAGRGGALSHEQRTRIRNRLTQRVALATTALSGMAAGTSATWKGAMASAVFKVTVGTAAVFGAGYGTYHQWGAAHRPHQLDTRQGPHPHLSAPTIVAPHANADSHEPMFEPRSDQAPAPLPKPNDFLLPAVRPITQDARGRVNERRHFAEATQRSTSRASGAAAMPPEDKRPSSTTPSVRDGRVDGPPGGELAKPDTLLAEARLLERVRALMTETGAAEALMLLQTNLPPAGSPLSEERAYAKAAALCLLKRTGEGRAEGSRLMHDHPDSPLAKRLHRVCAK